VYSAGYQYARPYCAILANLGYSNEDAIVSMHFEAGADLCLGRDKNSCPHSREAPQEASKKLKYLPYNRDVNSLVNPMLEAVNNDGEHSRVQQVTNRSDPFIPLPPAFLDILLAPPVDVAAQILKHILLPVAATRHPGTNSGRWNCEHMTEMRTFLKRLVSQQTVDIHLAA
jgi:hypothetical protein